MAIAAVTTGRKSKAKEADVALRLAREWGLIYVPRQGRSLDWVLEEARSFGLEQAAVIVAQEDALWLYKGDARFHYHPGMGLSRLRRVMRGDEDWMLRAMGVQEGDHILDATMGLASDLLVASFAAGESGRSVGLESEPLIALIVAEGLRTYPHPQPEVVRAMRRIEVIHTEYQTYLKKAGSRSFDVVYFDPMFERPVAASNQIAPLRHLANPAPLDDASLEEATRVARRRVVVKDRRDGPYATSDRFDEVMGGNKSRIAFCVRHAR